MARAIAKKEEGQMELFSADKPDYIGDEERGQEGVSVDDVTIPRIGVLQDLSPQIKKTKPEYIEGAETGQFFNNVTGELYGTEFLMVPVFFRKEYIIWKDRDSGGGFRGAFPTEREAAMAMAKLEDANMCSIKDTAQHFVLIVGPKTTADVLDVQEAVISMSGGTMASSRQLNSLVKIGGGDRFGRAYKVNSIEVNGAKGDYQSMKFHPVGYVSPNLYEAGEKMYEAIKAGEKDVDRREFEETDETQSTVDATEF